jgi:hypothetical protein
VGLIEKGPMFQVAGAISVPRQKDIGEMDPSGCHVEMRWLLANEGLRNFIGPYILIQDLDLSLITIV